MTDSNVITPPPGGIKRGRPLKPNSLRNIADAWQIPVRTLERAIFVQRHGVPELHRLVAREELTLGLAEYVARWPRDCQTEHCDRGAGHLRKLIPFVRMADLQEKEGRL